MYEMTLPQGTKLRYLCVDVLAAASCDTRLAFQHYVTNAANMSVFETSNIRTF